MDTNNPENKAQLIARFSGTLAELTATLSSFSEEQLNKVPFEKSWTAAQVGYHLLKSYSGAPSFLQGPVKATERDPAQYVEPLEKKLLDFSEKMNAPGFILPPERHYDQDRLVKDIDAISYEISKIIAPLDLTATCTGFALPVLGELTRLEWISFMIVHTRRHIHQLKNIRHAITSA